MASKYENHREIYVHRELLTYSLEGRRVDLLTITGRIGATSDCEEFIDDPILHPEERKKLRAMIFLKPIVFLSARVHPGEVPSSHVLNGLINFILKE